MHIESSEIRRIVNNGEEYRFAEMLDPYSFIDRMTVSLDQSSGGYRVNARVMLDEDYIVTIKIDENGHISQAYCPSSYHRVPLAYRYIGTILFFLQRTKITSFPYFFDRNQEMNKLTVQQRKQNEISEKKQEEALNMIDVYKNRLLKETQMSISMQRYQIKVFVNKDQDIVATFKISYLDKSYVIKDIQKFLLAIENHEVLKHGKDIEFVHCQEAFDEDTLEIIEFLKKYEYQNLILNRKPLNRYHINEESIDDFYHLMEGLPTMYCDLTLKHRQQQLSLDIMEDREVYVLQLKGYKMFKDVIFSPHWAYSLESYFLYRYNWDCEGRTIFLLKTFLDNHGELHVPKENLDDFYKYVLNDIMEYIQMDTTLFDSFYEENSISLYVDMTESEQLFVQLEYIYDDNIAYGFDEQHHLSKEADLVEEYIRPYIDDIDKPLIYLTTDHEMAFAFLKQGLPYLSKYCQIYVSEAIENLSLPGTFNMDVGVRIKGNMLEIDFDSLQVSKEEILDVLKAYKKKRKFYKLKNGKLMSLEGAQLYELNELVTSLQLDLTQEEMAVPAYRLFDIERLSSQQGIHGEGLNYKKNDDFLNFVDSFQHPQTFPVPVGFQDVLRSYQVEGYQWLRLMEHYGFSGILADDMGLGKTLQMIVYLESMKQENRTSIVITPASLLLNWQDELHKFASSLSVLCIYGTKQYREKAIKEIENYDIVITSYDYMRRDVDLYKDIEFHTVVLDEAQYIKNAKTQGARCVKKLRSKQRFALTGTPIENSLTEMWSLFDFLMPLYLYSHSYFVEHFEKPIIKDQNEEKEVRLKQLISPFILRRNKKDVLKELPEKIEKTMYFTMNEEEEKIYLAHLVQVNHTLQEKLQTKELGKVDILAMLTRLRQLCLDPRLVVDGIDEPSSKLKGCMELIHSLKENNQKILLFSAFTSVLHLIEEQCQKEHISYYVLEGSVSKTKRKQLVDRFQKDDTTLFLISLKAGGSGLNLTAAQAVIHFDPWWNMSAKNQATDRAHRIGQKNTVQVFSLIMKNSIEEKMMLLQEKKKSLSDHFVEGNNTSLAKLTLKDLKELFEVDHE